MNWVQRKLINYVLDLIREYPEQTTYLLQGPPRLWPSRRGEKGWTPPYGYDRVVPRDQNFK